MNHELLTLSSLVRRCPDVLFTPLNEELLALDEASGHCYSLNEVAGQLWQWMENPQPIRELCARLQEEFQVETQRCQREVLELLEGLREAGLVEVEAHGA